MSWRRRAGRPRSRRSRLRSSRSWAITDCSARSDGAGLGAPARDVGELPPPQRLGDVAGPVVLQAVGDAGGDVGDVVGHPRRDELGRVDVGVEHLGEVVDALEQLREPLAASRRGRGRARRRARTARLGTKSSAPRAARRRAAAGSPRAAAAVRRCRGPLAGDLAHGEQEALCLVGDPLRQIFHVARTTGCSVESSSTDRLPSKARPSVTSSAYSKSPPTGSPLASRVTRRPIGRSSRVR